MSKRILIVDDDPAQRRILEETIKRFGFETRDLRFRRTGAPNSRRPRASRDWLVLLDLVMPGIDGMAVLDAHRPQAGIAADHRADGARLDRNGYQRDARAAPSISSSSRRRPERLEVSIKSALEDRSARRRDQSHQEEGRRHADVRRPRHARRCDERVITLGKRAAASNIPV